MHRAGKIFYRQYSAKYGKENLVLQRSYYEELEKNQADIRKLRHDMNNHLSVIHSLFRSGDQEEAEQYMNEIESQRTTHTRVFCKNSIANAVLNAKYNLAQEHQIDCFFHIDLEKLAGIDAISLCCLFSNTLDISYTEETFTVTVLIADA